METILHHLKEQSGKNYQKELQYIVECEYYDRLKEAYAVYDCALIEFYAREIKLLSRKIDNEEFVEITQRMMDKVNCQIYDLDEEIYQLRDIYYAIKDQAIRELK